jgi:hypothetical protein
MSKVVLLNKFDDLLDRTFHHLYEKDIELEQDLLLSVTSDTYTSSSAADMQRTDYSSAILPEQRPLPKFYSGIPPQPVHLYKYIDIEINKKLLSAIDFFHCTYLYKPNAIIFDKDYYNEKLLLSYGIIENEDFENKNPLNLMGLNIIVSNKIPYGYCYLYDTEKISSKEVKECLEQLYESNKTFVNDYRIYIHDLILKEKI